MKPRLARSPSRFSSDQENALDVLVREELAVDPAELGGSAWEAAITSFLLFAIGAIIPVIPFFFLEGMAAIVLSLFISMIGLFIIGAGITLFTGRSIAFSGRDRWSLVLPPQQLPMALAG